MVVTASDKHAVRVQQAVLAAFSPSQPTSPTSSCASGRNRSPS